MALNDSSTIDEISLITAFQRTRRRLVWLVGLTLLGSLLGLGLNLLRAPLYETRAVFLVNLDLAKTGPLEQLSQDQLIGAAYTLMGSTQVLTDTLEQAQAEGIEVQSLEYFNNIFIERRQAQIVLRVRDRDPRAAAAIANLWAENANAALTEAHQHAMQFTAIWNYLTALGQCPQITGTPVPGPNLCGEATYEETHEYITTLYQEAETQKTLALGVVSELNFTLARQAQVPAVPVAHGRNTAALAGALAGFLAGAVLVSSWRRDTS